MTGNEIQRWSDEAMFRSESHDASSGPKAYLLSMTPDPLGEIASCAKMYKGEVVRAKSEVTHAERQDYLREMQKTKLKMPMESVQLHFMLDGVTRAFTHQLVRQRTAAYAQESMRFAVVEDMNEAVALPPSLAHWDRRVPAPEWHDEPTWTAGESLMAEHGGVVPYSPEFDRLSADERNFLEWRYAVSTTSHAYNNLVNRGMPAEDARGLMPTNITTRVHYITNLRSLLDHAGNRLCTQAQFEWRSVFAQIAQAIRIYNPYDHAERVAENANDINSSDFLGWVNSGDRWQYEAIADLLKPVCFQTGHCVFEADFDRKCSIRSRVQANAEIGRAPDEWETRYNDAADMWDDHAEDGGRVLRRAEGTRPVFIGAIATREWLTDPGAAR